jgi:phosphate:Na+ symporter
MLTTPPIAIQQTKNEIVNMAKIALENFNLAYDIICTLDYSQIEKFRANEDELNFLNKQLANFIVKLLMSKLGEKDRIYLSTAIRTISDLERIGDYAENIVECADRLKAADKHFSDDALEEINDLKVLIERLYDKVVKAYCDVDDGTLEEAFSIENTIDDVTNKMAESHIMRLSQGVCAIDVGAQYLYLTSTTERIADHLINVAKTINEYE